MFPKVQIFTELKDVLLLMCAIFFFDFFFFSLALASLKNCHKRCTGSFSRILKNQKINVGWAVFCSVSEDPCLTPGRRIDAVCRLPSAPLKCPWASGQTPATQKWLAQSRLGCSKAAKTSKMLRHCCAVIRCEFKPRAEAGFLVRSYQKFAIM